MANNLSTVEKNLRSIAKRYENVKYSVGLAVLFLMKGTSAFSEDNKIQEIEKQIEIIDKIVYLRYNNVSLQKTYILKF